MRSIESILRVSVKGHRKLGCHKTNFLLFLISAAGNNNYPHESRVRSLYTGYNLVSRLLERGHFLWEACLLGVVW